MEKPSFIKTWTVMAPLATILVIPGCFEFQNVSQPHSADPNSSFTVQISAITTFGDDNKYVPYFGVMLPVGWTVTDNLPFTHGAGLSGTFIYSDTLSQNLEASSPASPGYYWWVGAGADSVAYIIDDVYNISPEIHTDSQTGNFYPVYYLGCSHGDYKTSEGYLVTVGLPAAIEVTSAGDTGQGTLRAAINSIDYYGTITFSPSVTDTIRLKNVLTINKDVKIDGPANRDIVLSGNDSTRIIYIESGFSPEISNLVLTKGVSDAGGAIYCYNSTPRFTGLKIAGNHAYQVAGGIYCLSSSPIFENVTITANSAVNGTGGIVFEGNSFPVFDSVNRCNIFLNYGCDPADLANLTSHQVEVIVDTFTVLHPTSYHVEPLSSFVFDILHGKVEQIAADVYVSPAGDNANDGLTPGTPLKNIMYAASRLWADSTHPRTIYLLNGVYSKSSNLEPMPIILPEYFHLKGQSTSEVVIDAEGHGQRVIHLRNKKGVQLSTMSITGGCSTNHGIFISQSDPLLDSLKIFNNQKNGLYAIESIFNMKNCIINNNQQGIYLYNSSPVIDSTLIENNGQGIVCHYSAPTIKNSRLDQNAGAILTYNSGSYLKKIILQNAVITNNQASQGGGIYAENSKLFLSKVSLTYNNATAKGGGLMLQGTCDLLFDSINRCNIHSNRAPKGHDFYNAPPMIVLDTFTVLHPTSFHVFADSLPLYDILHGKYAQCDSNLYVSPQGNDLNSGLTSTEPLKTIHIAQSKLYPLNADTTHNIYLADGEYSMVNTGERFPVYLQNGVNLVGSSKTGVVLDAQKTGRVIETESLKSTISGLTIRGGEANWGGGIYCVNGDLTLENTLLTGNHADEGGGLFGNTSYLTLSDVVITNNIASQVGGGLCVTGSDLILSDVDVINNSSGGSGGGIYSDKMLDLYNVRITGNTAKGSGGGIDGFATMKLKKVTIWDNLAIEGTGGGIHLGSLGLKFDTTERSNIYMNRADQGADISYYSYYPLMGKITLDVDTFTVASPTVFHLYPLTKFNTKILHGLYAQSNSDLYVSPTGSNAASGLSSGEAVKSLYVAAAKIVSGSATPRTIHLAEGTYSPTQSGEKFPIFLPDFVSISGAGKENTVVDAGQQSPVLRLINNMNIRLDNISFQGGKEAVGSVILASGGSLWLDNLIIQNNSTSSVGSLFLAHQLKLNARSVEISNNTIESGAGFVGNLESVDGVLTNCLISNNQIFQTGQEDVSILQCSDSKLSINNSTIAGNSIVGAGPRSGGLSLKYQSNNVAISNSVFWNNTPVEIAANCYQDSLSISNSDIQGGSNGIIAEPYTIVHYLDGNIDGDPLFLGEGAHPYMLGSSSPCRNAGTPDTTGLLLPAVDLAGSPRICENRIDIGAYEWNDVGIPDKSDRGFNFRCYPNPLSETTILEYNLPETAHVKIQLVNTCGVPVAELVNRFQSAGTHTLPWDASGLSAGLYVVRMLAGCQAEFVKVIKR
jgi:predicted outer membrane repeat protein